MENVERQIFELYVETEKARSDLSKFKKEWAKFPEIYRRGNAQMKVEDFKRSERMKMFKKELVDIINPAEKMKKSLGMMSGMALGLGLNMLFLGMQIQRTAERIAVSSTKAFLEMERGQTAAGKAIISVSAAWLYLKFSIGQAIGTALQPLMPFVIKLIEWAAAFARDNPATVFTAIVGAITAGAFLSAMGQVITMFSSLINLYANRKEIASMFDNMSGKLTDIGGKLARISVGTISIGFAITEISDSYEHFQNGEFAQGLEAALSAAALATGGWLLFKGKTGSGVALLAIGYTFKLIEEEKLFKSFAPVLALFTAFGMTVRDAFLHAFSKGITKGIANLFIDALSNIMAMLVGPMGAMFGGAISATIKNLAGIEDTTGNFNAYENFVGNYAEQVKAIGSFDSLITQFHNDVAAAGRSPPTMAQPEQGRTMNNQKSMVFINNGNINTREQSPLLNPYGEMVRLM